MRWVVIGLLYMSFLGLASSVRGDEGMWLFNQLPLEYLKKTYGFEPTPEWTEHVMKSSVRFNVGGSASFISSNGLVLTNHHVASDTLHKLSDKDHNYLEDGFLAKSLAEELKAPDLELNQLMTIRDVTAEVNAAVKSSMKPEEAVAARRAVIARIEKESLDKTGLRSDVVTLYGGGQYHLYQYKKYTDVRLVWAPEAAIAFFGGDADNFEYPRFCLDACIFRVYENGKPAKIEHYLKWSEAGPGENELIFVSGNPGRTSRIFTTSALKYQRDVRMPFALNLLRRREIVLQQFGLQGVEHARRAREDLFGVQNSRKAYLGMLGGLQDPAIFAAKEAAEAEMLARIEKDPKLASYRETFAAIDKVCQQRVKMIHENLTFNSQLVGIAQSLVQMAAEDKKPSGERLPEYSEAGRESLEQQLFSEAPIYADLEQFILADALARTVELRGADDPFIKQMLNGKSPTERAAELVNGTRLIQVSERKQLAQGGEEGLLASTDSMIAFARMIDPEVRRLRKIADELAEIEKQAYAKITELNFMMKGTSVYPDATFTLRLAFGTVKGYEEGGDAVPAWTRFGGAFEHEVNHAGQDDFVLPESWKKARKNLNPETPFNFVSTADIIGGNSGSPVVNQKGELVGLIFDGNIQSLTADYLYTEKQSRSVSVHSTAIREALKYVYGAENLASELGK